MGVLAFLVIDPTIAAHLPVVLTDLPVAVLGATSVLLAWSVKRFARDSGFDVHHPLWKHCEPPSVEEVRAMEARIAEYDAEMNSF